MIDISKIKWYYRLGDDGMHIAGLLSDDDFHCTEESLLIDFVQKNDEKHDEKHSIKVFRFSTLCDKPTITEFILYIEDNYTWEDKKMMWRSFSSRNNLCNDFPIGLLATYQIDLHKLLNDNVGK